MLNEASQQPEEEKSVSTDTVALIFSITVVGKLFDELNLILTQQFQLWFFWRYFFASSAKDRSKKCRFRLKIGQQQKQASERNEKILRDCRTI